MRRGARSFKSPFFAAYNLCSSRLPVSDVGALPLNLSEIFMNSRQSVGWPLANTHRTKVWSIPKFPMFNIETLLELQRKNAAAWTQANRVLFEGLATFAQRERDLLQSTVDDYRMRGSSICPGSTFQWDRHR